MDGTTTCQDTMSLYVGTNDSYPYISSSVCETISTSTGATSTATTSPAWVSDNVTEFFAFLIFVIVFTTFTLDRVIGVKIRKNLYNTYTGNNAQEGKIKYDD